MLYLQKIMLLSALVFSNVICLELDAREVKDLNAEWQFVKSDVDVTAPSDTVLEWQKVDLPHTWNDTDAQSGGKYYSGTGCYTKTILVDKSQKDKRFFLRFEGVGQVAGVYVNGILVGEHKGSYAAFCFEITPALKFGEQNIILVKVDNKARPDIIPVNRNLFMVFGGIYRPVSLIVTDEVCITPIDYASPGVYIQQQDVSHNSATINVRSKLENGTILKKDLTLKTSIIDAGGKVVVTAKDNYSVIPTVVTTARQTLHIDNPHLWNGRPDPYLYQLKVEVFDGNKLVDAVVQPLGIRYYRMDPDMGFILNGKPYRLYGVCRHQEWKDCGSALSDSQHKTDFDMIYEMGTTSVRLAHYQQAEYVYSYCDQLGLVVWAEIPFVNTYTGQERDNAKQQMLELVRQNYNHPSIFIWGLHNEVYAKRSTDYPVLLTRELHDIAKTEDPDRWTVSVSGFGSLERSMDLHADLQGCNRYFGWYYGRSDDMANWIKGTKEKRPDNFVCIAEYGCGANIAHQSENPTKANPISGKFFAEQYQTDMHEVQWAAIEQHPFIWGSYLWNMFDFCVPGWNRGGTKGLNHKGLVTYDRSVKKDSFYFYKANWSDEPVLYIRDRRLIDRSSDMAEIKVYSNCAEVRLKINGTNVDIKSAGYAIYTCDAVLSEGKNVIEASAVRDDKTYTDNCTWYVDSVAAKALAKARAEEDARKIALASSFEESKKSLPENTIDGSMNTYWSTDEDNPWIRYVMEKEVKIGKLGIAWYKGRERIYPFEVEFSFDGQVWQQVFKGTNRQENGMEYYEFQPMEANYIRLRCHGNNKTGFSAICEVDIQGLKK